MMQPAFPRRWIVVVVCAAVCVAAFALPASATGPGGWDHLGTGATVATGGLDGRVDALLTAAPDALFAGGVFTTAGGNPARSIARWDGSSWHPLNAPALNGGVAAIAYDSGKLYVGGNFTDAGGDTLADFLAVWDGANWKPFCAPITANVTALQVIGRTLYIGGSFADGAGLASADKLVACNLDTGVASSTVDASDDINTGIYALTADSAGRLYAGGGFINMDQIPEADHVAMYDGTWHAMGAEAVDSFVRSLASDGTNVYVGSDSVNIAGIAQADHVARWDGGAWHAVGSNTAGTDGYFPATAFINGLVTSGSSLFATGSFQNANGEATADQIVGFNGIAWSPMGSNGAGDGPLSAAGNAVAFFRGQTVVGGNFTTAGGDERAGYITRYPGAAHPLTAVISLPPGGVRPFVGNTATLLATRSDGDRPIVNYRWHFTDGSADTTGPQVDHKLTKQGPLTITLTVTDSEGHTAHAATQFTINGEYPHGRFTYSPETVFVGDPIAFDATTSSDADGTIASYDWNWGDGTADDHTGKATHAFSTVGTHQVAVFVLDDNHQSGAAIHDLTVLALVIPSVSHAAMSNASFRVGSQSTAVSAAKARVGTRFNFTLAAPGKVTIVISRVHGRKVVTLTRAHLHNGRQSIPFTGRIRRHALKPGRYTARITAHNSKGTAKAKTVKFRIVP